jgi:outer membrane protein, heavy metal efflux system
MQGFTCRLCFGLFLTVILPGNCSAQRALTWQEVRAKFETANPTLQGGEIAVDEFRAQETTAYLRPNPNVGLLADQIDPFNGGPPHSTFGFLLASATVSYLHERQHKRELTHEGSAIAWQAVHLITVKT